MEMLEGISEVKMPVEGERMYFCVIVASRAGTKPMRLLDMHASFLVAGIQTYHECDFHSQ